MDIGTLTIQLAADMATLRRDMDDAKSTVGGAMQDIERTVGMAKTALVALAGIGSVGAFAGMIASTIEAQGALQDLATKTGASAAALEAFRVIGSTSGTSIDSIAAAMNKLGKNMVGATEEGKGAAAAIKALGLDFNTFKGLNAEDQLLAVGTAMNNFADGADKGAVAQELFGKAGAAMLPFLKDIGNEAGNVTAQLDEQEKAYRKTQAAMADAFGDNLTMIQRDMESWKRDLAEGMTPALFELSQAFLDVTRDTGGLKGEITSLSRDGTFTDWTRTAITGITYVMDAFSGLQTTIKTVGLSIGFIASSAALQFEGIGTIISKFMDGDFAGAAEAYKSTTRQQQTMTKEFEQQLDATWGAQTLGSKLRERMADLRETGVESEKIKPKLNLKAEHEANEKATAASKAEQKLAEAQAKALAKEIDDQKKSYDKLNGSLGEKIAAMQAEIDGAAPLAEWQKAEVKLLSELESGTRKMTDEQKLTTLQHIADMKAVEEKLKAYRDDKKASEDSEKANADMREALGKKTDAINAEATKIREHTETLGLNGEELEALVIQKGYDEAATYSQKAAWAEQNGLGADLVKQYKDQAKALTDLADAKQQGVHVKAAVDAAKEWQKTTDSIAKGLSSALTDAVLSGKDIWTTFRDFMVKTLVDGAIKNALSGVIAGAMTGLNSALGGIFGGVGSTASAATGAVGATGGLTGVLGSIGSGISGIGGSITSGLGSIGSSIGSFFGIGGSSAAGGAAAATGAVGSGAAGGAAAAGGGIGGLGVMGTAAAAVAALYATKAILHNVMGFGGDNTVLDARVVNGKGTYFDPNWGENGMLRDLSNVTVQKEQTTKGEVFYRAYEGGSGWPVGPSGSLSEMSAFLGTTIPAFRAGGNFGGGMRLVGENGPEIEVTGPSRIFDANTTASMLRSGGANESEVVQELRAMRIQLAQLQQDTRRTADATNGNPEAPMIVEIET